MQLTRLLKRLDRNRLNSHLANLDISSVCADSRLVREGSLFVAINGTKEKGSDYIDEAIRKGASCVISPSIKENIKRKGIPVIPFKDTRYALAVLSDEFFGSPSRKLKVVGVTGTNGKTTITYLIRSMLNKVNLSSGVIGTINHYVRDRVVMSSNTTPSAAELQFLLKEMFNSGCKYCVMEVSSHGLDQRRTEAVVFEAAIFTNLTQDHLDYHLNLDNYFQAKSRLFSGLDKNAYAIINFDSPFALRLRSLTSARLVSYAIDKKADVKAENLVLSLEGSEFTVMFNGYKTKIRTKLIGRHNVSNILASIAFAYTQKIDLKEMKEAVEGFTGVRGRLQRVKCKDKYIFVDYAHTPDALENVLSALRDFSKNNLIVVFGCGGERDRLKRPLMGKISEKYADAVVITSDNPRSEEPVKIAKDIALGIKGKNYKIILDREKAIRYALSKARKKDIVLIAGKGHENYQIFKEKKEEFDDIIVASALCNIK